MNDVIARCWICDEEATTREHRTKKSDLRTEFADTIQFRPLYFHDNKQKNRIIQSLNAKALKFPKSLCAHCNNTRTQSHDFAWAEFSKGIRGLQQKLTPNSIVHANHIFKYNTAIQLLNVHLYFVKIIGCYAVEHNLAINLAALAKAITDNVSCPNVYLRLAVPSHFANEPWYGASNAETYEDASSGQVLRISWLQIYGEFAVQLIYLAPDEKCDALASAWHPCLGTSRFMVADFRD